MCCRTEIFPRRCFVFDGNEENKEKTQTDKQTV